MKIRVIHWSKNSVPNYGEQPDFYLERDNWNDDSFYTFYTLHLSNKHTKDNKSMLIGGVKILKRGQQRNDIFLIDTGDFETLNFDFCSLGQSLDYYERISQIDKELQDKILSTLNDVIYNSEKKESFKDEEGYKISLMRNFGFDDDIFKLAPFLLSRDFSKMPMDKDLKFKFKTHEMDEFIEFDFDSPEYMGEWYHENLPNRIAVIVGKNGSGKTTLLTKISRLVFASSNDRDYLKEVASIEPKGLGFPRIISVSYSAFDAFQVPGIRIKEKEQIADDIQRGVGRYIYCGIRDISMELKKSLKHIVTEENGMLKKEDIINNKHPYNFLKPIDALSLEFGVAVEYIKSDNEKLNLFIKVINEIFKEPSLKLIQNFESINPESELDTIIDIFSELSTGHKFVFHSLASIIQHIENRSLVLFDEPEIHLHPPLLAVLMKALRIILNAKNSFMILSTHSPVVLQETLTKHVFVVRRVGNITKVTNPDIQTFGENIGIITSHIFGLSSDLTDYHTELDKISDSFSGTFEEKMNLIEQLFDGKLSLQARTYITSKLNEIDS